MKEVKTWNGLICSIKSVIERKIKLGFNLTKIRRVKDQ